MTFAKDRGMSIEEIFFFFHGGHTGVKAITPEIFINGLERLGKNLFALTDDELDSLVSRFDLNGDKLISLAEFKRYCLYEIHHASWKAERIRHEESGDIKILKAKIEEERRVKVWQQSYACGEEVQSTSKLFWKVDVTVDITLYYCEPLDLITVRLFNATKMMDMPLLYVKRTSCLKKSDKISDDDKNNIQVENESSEWDQCLKFIVARLKLKENETEAFMSRLEGECQNMHTKKHI